MDLTYHEHKRTAHSHYTQNKVTLRVPGRSSNKLSFPLLEESQKYCHSQHSLTLSDEARTLSHLTFLWSSRFTASRRTANLTQPVVKKLQHLLGKLDKFDLSLAIYQHTWHGIHGNTVRL